MRGRRIIRFFLGFFSDFVLGVVVGVLGNFDVCVNCWLYVFWFFCLVFKGVEDKFLLILNNLRVWEYLVKGIVERVLVVVRWRAFLEIC